MAKQTSALGFGNWVWLSFLVIIIPKRLNHTVLYQLLEQIFISKFSTQSIIFVK